MVARSQFVPSITRRARRLHIVRSLGSPIRNVVPKTRSTISIPTKVINSPRRGYINLQLSRNPVGVFHPRRGYRYRPRSPWARVIVGRSPSRCRRNICIRRASPGQTSYSKCCGNSYTSHIPGANCPLSFLLLNSASSRLWQVTQRVMPLSMSNIFSGYSATAIG